MNTKVETWKAVVGWPKYEVSDMGRVRRDGKIIKQFVVRKYAAFNVVDGRHNRKSLRVHREVVRAFMGERTDQVVRHLDGDHSNNALVNLVYGTAEENEADKRNHGTSLFGEKHHQAKLSEYQAKIIRASKQQGIVLARKFGVSPTQVSSIRCGRSWRHLSCLN